jgi:hypothetical protein
LAHRRGQGTRTPKRCTRRSGARVGASIGLTPVLVDTQ